MGLSGGIAPVFRLLANRADITDTVRERLVSIHMTDEAGLESDALEVVLSDEDPLRPIEIPPAGAELELFLGYDGQAQRMGLFVVDEIELAGWPGEMTIRARAAPFDQSKGGKLHLQTQKTRSWAKNTKLADMVKKIANEHGMEPAVSQSLAAITLPHIDQSDESDMHLLVRLAKKYDAVVKPAGGKLVLAKRGETKSASGQQLRAVVLEPDDVSSWRVTRSRREDSGTVVASWHVPGTAKRHSVKVGDGEPVTRLRMQHSTKDMALAAARSEMDRRERGKFSLSVSMPGHADLVAEAPLAMSGFRDGVDGKWIITRVEHTLTNQGYSCSLEAEGPNEGGQRNVVETVE